MVSLLMRATLFMARLYLRAKRSSVMQSSDSRGFRVLFLRFLHFVRNVFFSSVAKNKKRKSKNNTTHKYEHFFARTVRVASSGIIAREEKDAKVERYRRVVSLLLHVRTTDFYIVGASVI
jgi:hypothetical protein